MGPLYRMEKAIRSEVCLFNVNMAYVDLRIFAGDVIPLKIFGRRLFVLNSTAAAVELFEKRSAIYSERPLRQMADLYDATTLTYVFLILTASSCRCGFGKSLLFQKYGDNARKTRKLLHAEISQNVVHQHNELQEREVQRFIHRIVQSPKNLLADTRRSVGNSSQ